MTEDDRCAEGARWAEDRPGAGVPEARGWRGALGARPARGHAVATLIQVVSLAQMLQGTHEIWVVVQTLPAMVAGKAPDVAAPLLAWMVIIGLLRVVAGVLNRAWQGRWLSIAVSVAGVVTVPALCLPTSLVVLLLVLSAQLDRQLREAFRRRAAGASAREVTRWLHRPEEPRRAA